MVNNNNSNKKVGGMFDFFSKETREDCVAKCDKKYAPPSATTTPNEGFFSRFNPFSSKKEEVKQPSNQQPLSGGKSNQMGGKRRSKGSKKTRRNKKRKGTRKSSL